MQQDTEHVEKMPVWRHIEETIRGEILDRRWGPDDQLPPEGEIADRFQVSKTTARKALASLQQHGFIRIEPGRGTFVQDSILPYDLGGDNRFCHYLTSIKVDNRSEVINAGPIAASQEVASFLNLRNGESVIYIKTKAFADQRVVLVSNNYLPTAKFPGFLDRYSELGSITDTLKSYGISEKKRLSCYLLSRMPAVEEARLLQQPRTRPVTELVLVMCDRSRAPIWADISCFAGDRVKFILPSEDWTITTGP